MFSDRLRQQLQDDTAGRPNVTLDYPRVRRQGTLHPDQRALHLAELAEADAVNGYSFILTTRADRPGWAVLARSTRGRSRLIWIMWRICGVR